jgi:hypothetical protein
MRQEDIAVSKEHGVVYATSNVRIVLKGGPCDALHLCGKLHDQVEELKLKVTCNGLVLGEITIKDNSFSEELQMNSAVWEPAPKRDLPSVMQDYNEIELKVVAGTVLRAKLSALDGESYYGISSIWAQSTEVFQ